MSCRAEEMIYWFLDDPDIVEIGGGSVKIQDLVSRGEYPELSADVARVGAYDSSGELIRYLSIDQDGRDWIYSDTDIYLDVSPGTGTPGSLAGPAYADVSGFVPKSGNYDPSISFVIEIGTYTGDEGLWVVLAASSGATLDDLRKSDHLISDVLDIHGTTPWSGGAYMVPEPSSGLLLLVGAGLLSLRRRRRAV